MKKLNTDLKAFNTIGLKTPPVGVKFLYFKPKGIKPLAKTKALSFCEMLIEAQTSAPFYIGKDNPQACIGKILLGMEKMEPFAESGQIGPGLGMFQEPRANYAFYKQVPRFDEGIVNYVAFSRLEELNFKPDVLIVTATPSQAEIVMRAMTYSTGELYNSRTTPVMGCAWLYIYPFQSGQVNYIIPALIHGMGGRRLAPENMMFISIPHQWLPTITKNLKEMPIHLKSHESKEKYLAQFEDVVGSLVKRAKNP